jgi:hypothetical protein
MRLGEIKKVTARQSEPTPCSVEPEAAEPAVASRALVALTPAPSARDVPGAHRQAPFLAQLLAMKDQHPQTRQRRRAEPDQAVAAYRAAAELTRFG